MLVEPVWQNHVSKRAWESNVPIWMIPPGHPKLFERILDIISLFVLAILNTTKVSIYFQIFLAVPYVYENVRKMKLFHTD